MIFTQALAPSATIFATVMYVMIFADPAADLIGNWFDGRMVFLDEKTIEGTVAFVVVGTGCALLFISPIHAVMFGLVGGCVEAYSGGRDNIAIPVALVVLGWLL